MQIYNYDALTAEYVGTGLAAQSPLEDGVFLIPAHATTVAPPAEQAGFARVFADGAWSQVQDHRGQVYWTADGEEHTMESLGPLPVDALPDKPVITPPPEPPKTTDQLKAEARLKRDGMINAIEWRVFRYQSQVALGVTPSDTEAQYQAVLGYVQELRDVTSQPGFPTSITWPVAPN